MIAMLVLGAAMAAQDVPAAGGTGPPARFVICPGHRRCPARPSRQSLRSGGGPIDVDYGRADRPHITFIAPPSHGGGSPGNSLLFGPGESALSVEARELLELIADRPLRDPSLEIVLEGHADGRGSAAANRALAGRRAAAAADHLIARGFPAERIVAVSWGEAAGGALAEPRSVVVSVRARSR